MIAVRRKEAMDRTEAESRSFMRETGSSGFGLEPWDSLVGRWRPFVAVSEPRQQPRPRAVGGLELCVFGIAAATGAHLLQARRQRKRNGSKPRLKPASSSGVPYHGSLGSLQPSAAPPSSGRSSDSGLPLYDDSSTEIDICRNPANSSFELQSPARCATPPEHPPAFPEKQCDAGNANHVSAARHSVPASGVRDSAVELTTGVSSEPKRAGAKASPPGESSEVALARPSPRSFCMDELKHALRERLQGEEMADDLRNQLSNLGNTRQKEEDAVSADEDNLEVRLEREQQQVAQLRRQLQAVSDVNRSCTVEVSVLSQKLAALQEGYAQAEWTARAAVDVLQASHEDYSNMTRLLAQLEARRALEQQAAVEASAEEHQEVIQELELQLKEHKQMMRHKQQQVDHCLTQVSATDSMSRMQKDVIYRLREELSSRQQAKRAVPSATEGDEPVYAEVSSLLESAIQTVQALARQVPDPLASVVAELEGQLVKLRRSQRITVRSKLRRSLECRQSLEGPLKSLSGSEGQAAGAVEDDELFGILPTTILSRVAALLLAIKSDTESAKGKRPKPSGHGPFPASSRRSAQSAKEAARQLCALLSSPGTAELVLRADGVGILVQRLSVGTVIVPEGLRLALLEALNQVVTCTAQESRALSDLSAAGGVATLTATLSDRLAERDVRLAAARLLCSLSSLPCCWPEMASQGATRVLVSALDTDRAEDAELVEQAALSCCRLSADEVSLDVMRRAGGRWLFGATARAKASTRAARKAALCVLRVLEGERESTGDEGATSPLPAPLN